ncbi:MAG: tRNA 2-thiouridine(34) synthase MnmA, partial [bacterium]|nr:tRNA 2-thiouridine(34) synthase MnmA [bacterium]
DARRVAEALGIPFYVWDFEAEYKERVAQHTISEYAAGRTPNPDVLCNKEIKFGLFLERARALGADYIATGHYVRKEPEFPVADSQHSNSPQDAELPRNIENYKLKVAKDLNKDQSYFLWTLTQEQLRHCLFPIGDYLKPEVRALAREFGLPTADKKDSQGLCFVGEVDMQQFLGRYIAPRPGAIVTASGKTIGRHQGLSFYTIGQRRGIEIGGGIPYYVAQKDSVTNTLVVAEGPYDEALFRQELTVHSVNWISSAPKLPLRCQARIRYRQPLQEARMTRDESGGQASPAVRHWPFSIRFTKPQRAVTPGQSIVFYLKEAVIGGGVIAE